MKLAELNEAELINECPHILIMQNQKWDIDFLGKELSSSSQGFGVQNSVGRIPPSLGFKTRPRDLWGEVKKEFYLLVCTKDRKYAELRSQFNKKSQPATAAILSMISAAVAGQLGVAVGMITPLVALLLYGILKLSVNGWCNIQNEAVKSDLPK